MWSAVDRNVDVFAELESGLHRNHHLTSESIANVSPSDCSLVKGARRPLTPRSPGCSGLRRTGVGPRDVCWGWIRPQVENGLLLRRCASVAAARTQSCPRTGGTLYDSSDEQRRQ